MHEIQEQLLKLAQKDILSGKSLREIGVLVGEGSPQKIKHHLTQLAKKGFIVYTSDSRRIVLGGKSDGSIVSLPIVGSADCGAPTKLADQRVEGYLRISKKLLPRSKNLIVLRASGDSMNRAHIGEKTIEDGDFVLVDTAKQNPSNGDYVVSVIDEVANIKKFEKDEKNNHLVLRSESTSEHLPIYIHEDDKYCISGTVVGVIKK